ncbi:cytochrome P450 [Aspergillus stella-maris]|uniref:cytochrome P450 n=1 Tax=Aspergillus stella-maris TaxID=1810926 RepID=UPI003CCE2D47
MSLIYVSLLGPAMLITAFLLYVSVNEIVRWTCRIKGLPGPRGLPLVGNLRDINRTFSAEQYRKWSLTYGPVYQVRLGNTPVVIVNGAEEAKTLFLNQSSALISRPVFHVLHKTVSNNVASIGTSPWNESCKTRRKIAASALNRPQVRSYEPIILRETEDFINGLSADSGDGTLDTDFTAAVHRLSLNMVMTLNYGRRIAKITDLKDDSFYAEVIEVENEISRLRSTSKNISNYIPLLRLLEPIFWRKSAAHSAAIGRRRIAYNNELLHRLKDAVARDEDVPCIQGNVLRDPEAAGLTDGEVLSISFSMMAGADSTQPTLGWAFLLLAHRQDIQKKAFQELQSVVGTEYKPNKTKDVEYIYALVKEVLRFYTPLPLSMPRETTAPVQYKDTAIPAGTMVFLNAWACNHDTSLFPTPWTFDPNRWVTNTSKHAHQFAFGYGSRMCVASHLATRLVYTVLYHAIARFEIRPAEGQDESEADPIKGIRDPTALSASPRGGRVRFVPRGMFSE